MGYDLTRFVKEVDEEFICPICTMVLENGVQSQHCEHTYCDACIKEWLIVNQICPIDRNELSLKQIKSITRALNNLILKLEIKCAFEENGCQAIIKLENLETHSNSCLHNPNAKITCEKDCGQDMTPNEYSTHNCVRKLASVVVAQQKQISLLENELHGMRNQLSWKSDTGLVVINNIIKCVHYCFGYLMTGLAQYPLPLTENNPYIEIKLIDSGNNGLLYIGLDRCRLPPNSDESYKKRVLYNGTDGLAYIGYGLIRGDKAFEGKSVPKWKEGDTIGCGTRFTNTTANRVIVYFTLNKKTVWEISRSVHELGLYPTFYTNSVGAKIIATLI